MNHVGSLLETDAPPAGAGAATRPDSGRVVVLRRLLDDRAAVAGAVVGVLIVATLLAAPLLTDTDPTAVDPVNRLSGFSAAHPLGTDLLGRDVASRLLHGGRASVLMAIAATAAITAIGLTLGLLAGVRGGAIDGFVMRTVDVLMAVPLIIVAMVVLGLLGGGPVQVVLTVAALGWPGYARVVRASALVVRESGYVEAARAMGASRRRVARHHVLPNILGPVVVLSTLDLGRILLTLTALSFLGFGVQPPQPEWGALMAEARSAFHLAPRLLFLPGIAISGLALAVNLLGDGLRDALDPRPVGR